MKSILLTGALEREHVLSFPGSCVAKHSLTFKDQALLYIVFLDRLITYFRI